MAVISELTKFTIGVESPSTLLPARISTIRKPYFSLKHPFCCFKKLTKIKPLFLFAQGVWI